MQLHVYNQLSKYGKLAAWNGLNHLFTSNRNGDTSSDGGELALFDACWDKFWSLVGAIRLEISSGRFVASNSLLPTMLVCSTENFSG
jgi:hypothetical protein